MLQPKVDIVAAILEFCRKPTRKSDLRKISPGRLNEYLNFLLSKNFIEMAAANNNSTYAKTTEKGIRFLDMYYSIKTKYLTTAANK